MTQILGAVKGAGKIDDSSKWLKFIYSDTHFNTVQHINSS